MQGCESISIVLLVDPLGHLLFGRQLIACKIQKRFETLKAIVESAFVQKSLSIGILYFTDENCRRVAVLFQIGEKFNTIVILYLLDTVSMHLTNFAFVFASLYYSLDSPIAILTIF